MDPRPAAALHTDYHPPAQAPESATPQAAHRAWLRSELAASVSAAVTHLDNADITWERLVAAQGDAEIGYPDLPPFDALRRELRALAATLGRK